MRCLKVNCLKMLFENEVGDHTAVEQLTVFDLPQIYQRPSAEALLNVLEELTLAPPSWDVNRELPARGKIHENGIPAYLTNIISNPLTWINGDEQKEKIWEAASQRLSERTGRTGRGDLTRSFLIPTGRNSDDTVTIELHEPALQADNLGLKTWASSYLLAKRLSILRPTMLELRSHIMILELGAGTGLVGLAAAAICKAHVVLTDLPEIVPNLERNVSTNLKAVAAHGGEVQTAILDWSTPHDCNAISEPYSFPLILAADPIYSADHPRLLVQAIQYHLSRKGNARVMIELPLREAYVAERADLNTRMRSIGLELTQEGEETGFDDWSHGNERAEVKCWWSIWSWGPPPPLPHFRHAHRV